MNGLVFWVFVLFMTLVQNQISIGDMNYQHVCGNKGFKGCSSAFDFDLYLYIVDFLWAYWGVQIDTIYNNVQMPVNQTLTYS